MNECNSTTAYIIEHLKVLNSIRQNELQTLATDILGIYYTCKHYDKEYNLTMEQHKHWRSIAQMLHPTVRIIKELYPELSSSTNSITFNWNKHKREQHLSRIYRQTPNVESSLLNDNTILIQATHAVATRLIEYKQGIIDCYSNANKEMPAQLAKLFEDAEIMQRICEQLASHLSTFCPSYSGWLLTNSTSYLPDTIHEPSAYLQ